MKAGSILKAIVCPALILAACPAACRMDASLDAASADDASGTRRHPPTPLDAATSAPAAAFSVSVTTAAPAASVSAAAAPTTAPASINAEYAIRWLPKEGGPQKVDDVLKALALVVDDTDKYEIQYYNITAPASAPDGATAILRQRKKGKDKYDLRFKYRGSAPFPALPDGTWECPLKDAKKEPDQVDFSFTGAEEPKTTHSRACTVQTEKNPPPIPETLKAVPLGCVSKMIRRKAGKTKVEEWSLPNGDILIEVSRTEEQGTNATRDAFKKEVVDVLLDLKVKAVDRSKTEAGSSCQ